MFFSLLSIDTNYQSHESLISGIEYRGLVLNRFPVPVGVMTMQQTMRVVVLNRKIHFWYTPFFFIQIFFPHPYWHKYPETQKFDIRYWVRRPGIEKIYEEVTYYSDVSWKMLKKTKPPKKTTYMFPVICEFIFRFLGYSFSLNFTCFPMKKEKKYHANVFTLLLNVQLITFIQANNLKIFLKCQIFFYYSTIVARSCGWQLIYSCW